MPTSADGRLCVISDMDGVIYRGRNLIPGAQEFVAHLRSHDIPFLFLTNNSEQTPLDLVRKLEGLGIHGLREGNFITAARVISSVDCMCSRARFAASLPLPLSSA